MGNGLGTSVLDIDVDVILQISSDAGQVLDQANAVLAQMFGGTNPRQH